MPKRVYTLEQKQAMALDRKHRREERAALMEAYAKQRFERRVEKYRKALARERARMEAEVAVMRLELAEPDRTFAFPTPAEREVIRAYRKYNEWSVRRMAKHCRCSVRQIGQIESDARSVYLLKRTLERILVAVNYRTALDAVDHGIAARLEESAREEAIRRVAIAPRESERAIEPGAAVAEPDEEEQWIEF